MSPSAREIAARARASVDVGEAIEALNDALNLAVVTVDPIERVSALAAARAAATRIEILYTLGATT